MESATLLIFCPDRRGLVAAITDFIFRRNGNVLHLEQHVDVEHNVFFMRVQWDLAGFEIPKDKITTAFTPLAEQYGMTWRVHFSDEIQRMALFVSKEEHCLYDLLSRWQSGDLRVHIALIISNHPTLGHIAEKFNIPFH